MGGQKKNKIQDYITFPLRLIDGLLLADAYQTKKIIHKIVNYGIADFAINKCNYDGATLAKQAVYLFYNGYLPDAFMKEAQEALDSGELILFSETKGFNSKGIFEPEPSDVRSLFDFINKGMFINEIWDWCRVSLNIPSLDKIGSTYSIYLKILEDEEEFVEKYGNDATVSVKSKMFEDFYNEPPDRDLLAAYFAIRSLQGMKKNYIRTHKKTIITRMAGCKTKDLGDEMKAKNPKLSERMEKLEVRRTFEKLLFNLEERGLLRGRFILPKKVSFFLLSTSSDAVEIARFYAKAKHEKDRRKKQNQALDVYNQLIAETK